jgi:hypothetical protein
MSYYVESSRSNSLRACAHSALPQGGFEPSLPVRWDAANGRSRNQLKRAKTSWIFPLGSELRRPIKEDARRKRQEPTILGRYEVLLELGRQHMIESAAFIGEMA